MLNRDAYWKWYQTMLLAFWKKQGGGEIASHWKYEKNKT